MVKLPAVFIHKFKMVEIKHVDDGIIINYYRDNNYGNKGILIHLIGSATMLQKVRLLSNLKKMQ